MLGIVGSVALASVDGTDLVLEHLVRQNKARTVHVVQRRVIVHSALVHYLTLQEGLVKVTQRARVGDGAADTVLEYVRSVQVVLGSEKTKICDRNSAKKVSIQT